MRIRLTIAACLATIILAPALVAQERWPTKSWSTAVPASVGVDAKPLEAFDAELRDGKFGSVDSFLVIRCGQVAFERSYKNDYAKIYGERAKTPGPLNHDLNGPYNYFHTDWHPFKRGTELHTMQSVSKTVTSVTIGVAQRRGEFPDINTPVLQFFDVSKIANVDDRKRRMTIRHLLTMTAGFDWHEDLPYADPNNSADQMEASKDWVQFAIDRPMAEEPGKLFVYNSGATQILSHIFKKVTGQDISDYAEKNLFQPLGILHYWKRTPTGLSDTEGGLYLRAQDLARIGYLFLKNGMWEGKPIVTADWVKASVAPSIAVGTSGIRYGYKWWLFPYEDGSTKYAYGGSGFGGQRLFVLPEKDLIIVFTGWTILNSTPPSREFLNRVLASVKVQGCSAAATAK